VLSFDELSRHSVLTMSEASALTRAFDVRAAEQGLRVQRIVASNSLVARALWRARSEGDARAGEPLRRGADPQVLRGAEFLSVTHHVYTANPAVISRKTWDKLSSADWCHLAGAALILPNFWLATRRWVREGARPWRDTRPVLTSGSGYLSPRRSANSPRPASSSVTAPGSGTGVISSTRFDSRIGLSASELPAAKPIPKA
jgi:hypothetical protein